MNREAAIQTEPAVEDIALKRRFQPYPDYQDSSVEWLGRVPEHWLPARLADHVCLINGYPFDSAQFSRDSGTPLIRIRDILRRNTEVRWAGPHVAEAEVDDGDVLIGMDGAFNVGWWLGGKAVLNQRVCCLRAKARLNQRYLYYFISAPLRAINDVTYSTTVKHLSSFDVLKVRYALPPLDEQQAIAAFLDLETARIDELIAEKQRLVELLAEKRTALISHAVTKGLNPDAPMQDSSIHWLGQVPMHWERKRIKHLLHRIVDTEHKTAPFYPDGDFLVVRTTNVRNGRLVMAGAKFTDAEGYAEWTGRAVPRPGDILFTREAPAGEACLVPDDRLVCLGQRMVLFEIRRERLDGYFCLYSIYSGIADEFIKLLSQGSTVAHFNMSDIGNIPLLVPPIAEQRQIATYVHEQAERLDGLMNTVADAIGKLREYRSALISAAVTGKIDVRCEVN